nr:dipeptidase PepE [Polaromonas sp. YR568]
MAQASPARTDDARQGKATKRLLLMSSSRKGNLPYLAHADAQFHRALQGHAKRVLFIPYAAVVPSFSDFEAQVTPVFERLGYACESIHRYADPKAAVASAEAIVMGGGNTFALLKRLYEADLIGAIRDRVLGGMPYVGWSAGANVAGPTMRTTNDMPVVEPPSLKALNLVPFQINPHFISGKPPGFNGESREERLAEFFVLNSSVRVLALPEGTGLFVEGDYATVMGEAPALRLRGGMPAVSLPDGTRFALTD